jgi:uroporphyrinogen-III decarboxylase
MTSRERLLTVLEGGIPDRVPISTYELAGWNSRAFENNDPSYARLMQAIRERADCVCMWDPATNEKFLLSAWPVEIDLAEARAGNETVTRRRAHTPGGTLTETARLVDNVHTTWRTERWCKTPRDVDAALSVPYEPVAFDYSDYERIAGEVGDRGILMASLPDALCIAAELMEFGAFTLWAYTETAHFTRALDRIHERIMINLRRMLDGKVLDLYRICGPEYATPPYLPREMFDRFVTPYVRDMVRLIHERGGKARFHCHGRIGQVLEFIQATEADALDPCEPPPDGDIELADVKRQIGEHLCLFGNVELKTLELGTREEVEHTVRACMDAAKPGGRYVIMPTAAPITSPLSATTEANYLTYIDTAIELGGY